MLANHLRWSAGALCLVASIATSETMSECGPRGGPDWERQRGITRTLAAGLSGDSGAYVSAGLIAGWKPAKCNRCGLAYVSSGTLLQAALGTHAAKLSVGAASVHPFLGSGALKMSLERTWRDKGPIGTGNTYLGPEVQIGYMFGTLSTGALLHVAGPARRTVRWSWSLGVGF